ncbi:MAG: glutathione peroxidase [Elusimicrobia bacterium]|nr:MAG: glutathione peroxidase [Elusimicrobiota bacterium]
MRKSLTLAAVALCLTAASPKKKGAPMTTAQSPKLYSFEMQTNAGKPRKLSDYKGQVVLVVNTASKCGLTPQYKGLEALYRKFKDKGFVVAAFPANEFGAQEPGTDSDIKTFCELNYKTTFDLYSKIVVKGPGIHPLYAYLTKESPFPGDIGWNFAKFLVAKDGTVAARFDPKTEPEAAALVAKVEELLK